MQLHANNTDWLTFSKISTETLCIFFIIFYCSFFKKYMHGSNDWGILINRFICWKAEEIMKWNSSYIQVNFHKSYIYLWHWAPMWFFLFLLLFFHRFLSKNIALKAAYLFYILRRIILFIYSTSCGIFLNREILTVDDLLGSFLRKRIILGSQKMEVMHSFPGADFIASTLTGGRKLQLHPQANCHCFLMSWSGSSEGSSENGSWANPKKWLDDV